MKKFLIIIIVIVLALFLVSLVRDRVIKSIITVIASKVTGAKVTMANLAISLPRQTARIKDFKMYNPSGFPKEVMIDIPDIYVDWDLPSIMKGKIYLEDLEINLKELNLVRNEEGKLNVDALNISQDDGKDGGKSKQMPMRIDLLNLEMGKIISQDYSGGGKPIINVYDVNLKKAYKNITSAQQLAVLILTEPMKAAGIKGAKIYGAATFAGMAILPVAAASTFLGKDSTQKVISAGFDKLYDLSLNSLKSMGSVGGEDKTRGVISAVVNGANVSVQIRKISGNESEITVSARKLFLPKPEIASGVLYNIEQQLK